MSELAGPGDAANAKEKDPTRRRSSHLISFKMTFKVLIRLCLC